MMLNPRRPQKKIKVEPGAVGYLGCSGVATALGLSDYATKRDAFLRFIGKAPKPTEEEQKRFDRGHRAEAFIAKEIEAQYGLKLMRVNLAYVHPRYGKWICHPDRLVKGRVDGKRIGIEIKSSSFFTNSKWGAADTDEVPIEYFTQCLGYFACGVCDEVWLFRYSDWELTRYIITYDGVRVERLELMVGKVLEDYENGIEPEPSNYAESIQVWSDPEGDLEADEELRGLVLQYKEAKDTENKAKKEADELKDKIAPRMKGKKRIVDAQGMKLISYNECSRTDFSRKRFREDYPDLYEEYCETTNYFQFR